jgi:ABC transporter DrrB family efflux protein
MFVLLFAYVFGSAIPVPGVNYKEFLMPGIFVQTVAFGAAITAIGLAEDLQKGMVDRFRSLPMSRAAVLIGRTTSDLLNNIFVVAVMSLTGLIVGWRIHNGIGSALLGFGLLLLFAYAVSWVMAYVGLAVPSAEMVNSAAGMVIFPLTFVANTFVPADNLPTPLRIFAEWNPISAVTQAARELFGNIPPGVPEPSAWALQNAVLYTLIWVVAIIAIFAPLAIRKYTTTGSRR